MADQKVPTADDIMALAQLLKASKTMSSNGHEYHAMDAWDDGNNFGRTGMWPSFPIKDMLDAYFGQFKKPRSTE